MNGKDGLPGPKGDQGIFDENVKISVTIPPLIKRDLFDSEEAQKERDRRINENHGKSRLNYLSWEESKAREGIMREQWINTCQSRNHQFEIARIIAKQNPTRTARLLYGRSNISAFLEKVSN